VRIGAIVPQGWVGEYDGWDPLDAWRRTTEVARQAEQLGFESIWLFDHFHTIPRPTDEITFESFTSLSALAAVTERVRLGHIVMCTAFRNPALTAKMISTMDTISGGRMELGIGAGWKRDEWLAYGYGFPETSERLARLGDDLGVITAMLAGDKHEHATFEGRYATVRDARNVPKPIQRPRVPIMVGGNGPNVTWRLAARHADELNLDGVEPPDVVAALPVIASRCDEVGRDPATLPVSVHLWSQTISQPGAARVDRLAAFRETGVSRVMGLVRASTDSDEALASLAEDARAAGVELADRRADLADQVQNVSWRR
jgi:F420-dependent oxidoreductase-like protein